MDDTKQVEAKVIMLSDLLNEKLTIPSYQRPYVWTTNHVDKLFNDWKEFIEDNNNQLEYFMGTLLLYKNNDNSDEFEIIDGQQRLTTLFLILLIVKLDKFHIPENFSILPVSKTQVKNIYNHITKKFEDTTFKELANKVIPRICFNFIKTSDQDDAFTFFDAQNSRGVKPSETVLIKAFHLRSKDMNEQEQVLHAEEWERYDKLSDVYGENFLDSIIAKILWRTRNWKGQKKHKFEYEQIEEGVISNLEYEFNTLSRKSSLTPYSLDIRVPLIQGSHTFNYIHHYAKLIKSECFEKNGALYSLIETVYKPSSRYMLEFFLMGVVIYMSKFEKHKLYDFSYRLTRLIAILRISQPRINKETLESSYLRTEHKQNLFDMILMSYDPEEVLDEMIRIERYNLKKSDFNDLLNKAKEDKEYGPTRKAFADAFSYYEKILGENK